MKIANALDRFCRQLVANGHSGHTQAAYRRDVEALSRWAGKNPGLSAVTPDILARFLTSNAALGTPDGQPRSPMSVNRTKSALRSFFAFCVESGWLKENPARLIRSSPATPKEPTTLTEEEVAAIRAILAQESGSTADRDRLAFEILLGTGVRLGSLVGLNVGDVDLKQGTLQIKSKGGRRERVFLNPGLVRLIGQYLSLGNTARDKRNNGPEANSGPSTPLFRSIHGRRLVARQVQLNFAKWCRDAGIPGASVHSLRHTFAIRLYEKTGDLHLVQRALGHRQITTTEVYARVSDLSIRRALTCSDSV